MVCLRPVIGGPERRLYPLAHTALAADLAHRRPPNSADIRRWQRRHMPCSYAKDCEGALRAADRSAIPRTRLEEIARMLAPVGPDRSDVASIRPAVTRHPAATMRPGVNRGAYSRARLNTRSKSARPLGRCVNAACGCLLLRCRYAARRELRSLTERSLGILAPTAPDRSYDARNEVCCRLSSRRRFAARRELRAYRRARLNAAPTAPDGSDDGQCGLMSLALPPPLCGQNVN